MERALSLLLYKATTLREFFAWSQVAPGLRARALAHTSSLTVSDISSLSASNRLMRLLSCAHFQRLEFINVDSFHVADVDSVLHCLASHCRNLTSVDLRCYGQGEAVCREGVRKLLEGCSTLQSLTLITITGCGIFDAHADSKVVVPAITPAPALRHLTLHASVIIVPDLRWLPHLESATLICQRLVYAGEGEREEADGANVRGKNGKSGDVNLTRLGYSESSIVHCG